MNVPLSQITITVESETCSLYFQLKLPIYTVSVKYFRHVSSLNTQ